MQGRYSFVGAQPSLEVVAKGRTVEVIDHRPGRSGQNGAASCQDLDDPMQASTPSMHPIGVPCTLDSPKFLVTQCGKRTYPSRVTLTTPLAPLDQLRIKSRPSRKLCAC